MDFIVLIGLILSPFFIIATAWGTYKERHRLDGDPRAWSKRGRP